VVGSDVSSRVGSPRRTVIIMCDGLGQDYYEQSPMPTLKSWAASGVYAPVQAVMPTVTNSNNASICCGVWPAVHGVIGNSFLDERSGEEEYLEDGALVLAPTIFERAAPLGISSALLTSKKKTTSLLGRGAHMLLAAEAPEGDWEMKLGKAPPIYSCEINYWLFRAALHLLRDRPDIGLLYVHTTDYPMHMWPPAATESKQHLAELDSLLAQMARVAPDASILVSADHGMNFKSRCWDLEKALAERGAPVRIAISAERDKYLRHHRGMGGTAWVHLNTLADQVKVAGVLEALAGVERVLTRTQAAAEFNLMPNRIGDLVVLGDRETVFGNLEVAVEALPPGYRTHGSVHELAVPIVIHNAPQAPRADYFKRNLDLARWLFRA
jgi:phosphonoacetate hydrolase